MTDMQATAGTEEEPVPHGVATWIVEAVVACLVLAFGLLILWGSRKLGSGWTSDGPGSGYFPFYIGVILCISAAGTLYQALTKRNTDVFVDNEQLKLVMMVFVPALVYVLAVQFFGLYVASAVYIAGFMYWLGKYSPAKSVLLSVLTMAAFFAMFEIWFKVPLFKGSLDPLSFLGY